MWSSKKIKYDPVSAWHIIDICKGGKNGSQLSSYSFLLVGKSFGNKGKKDMVTCLINMQ